MKTIAASVGEPVVREIKERPDLLSPNSPKRLRIIQVTTDPKMNNSNIYMESHVFTPDSKRFVYQRFRSFNSDDHGRTARDTILCLCKVRACAVQL